MPHFRPGLGFDLGGTKLDVIRVDAEGRIQAHQTQPLPSDRSAEGLARTIGDLGTQMGTGPKPRGPEACGFSVAAVLQGPRATARMAPNLPALLDRPLRPWVERLLGRTVTVVNDANAGAEVERGRHPPGQDLLYVILGTGIGGGWVLSGRVYTGPFGSAGEVGHVYVGPPDRVCGCGLKGCLEATAGGAGLARRAEELMPRPVLTGGGGPPPWTAREVLLLAERGHRVARALRDDAGRVLGRTLASLANATGVGTVVVEGHLFRGAPGYFHATERAWKEGLIRPLQGRARLLRARPFPHRMAYGAWSLAQRPG
jgi:glucokinase